MAYEDEIEEEYWLDLAEAMGEELGVDTREGSVYMDTQAGHCIRTAKFFNDLAMLRNDIMPDTAMGDYLSAYTENDMLTRHPATYACWDANFIGAEPPVGTEFMCDNAYLTWSDVAGTRCLVANDAGDSENMLVPGSKLIPTENIDNLESATLGELLSPGRAEESDDELRLRWREAKVNPSANSNISQLKRLCEDIEDVGRARILPLWGGPNTVKAILFSVIGKDISAQRIEEIQEYMDPIENGYHVQVNEKPYVFGDGLGEGAVNIGLHFLATSAVPLPLIITADVEMMEGYVLQQVLDTIKGLINAYLSKLALYTPDKAKSIVRIATIGSYIAEAEGILDYDYDSLRINGGVENITVEFESVAVLSEVVLNVS